MSATETVSADERLAVQTVTGPIDVADMGVTMTHEHVFVNASSAWWNSYADNGLADAKVEMSILGRLRHSPFSCKDNLLLADEHIAREELALLSAAGGRTVLDPTCTGLGRNVRAQARVSEATGVNIVAGSGYYVSFARPPEFRTMSLDAIADRITTEVTKGTDGTDIRCGFIGEIGVTDESTRLTNEDERLLRAAARAQAECKVPLLVHLVDPLGHEVIDLLVAEGANPSATVLCHMPHTQDDLQYQLELASRGVWLGYDLYGIDWYFPAAPQGRAFQSPTDDHMVAAAARVIEAGFSTQLLLSSDTCCKMQLVTFGGCGYAHVLENIVPRFLRLGVPQDVIDTMLTDNPANLFVAAATGRVFTDAHLPGFSSWR